MANIRLRRAALAASVLVLLAASACSKNGPEQTEGSAAPSGTANATASPTTAAKDDESPLGKYGQEITVTTVRAINSGWKYQSGDSLENNIWTRSFKSDLNINLVNKWVVSDQQYKNKMTVSMVSGDLPDFFMVDDQQLQLLVQAGQIADLTQLYDKYASELTKKSFGDKNEIRLQAATFDGKIMALPRNGGSRDDAPMIWIRNDWLKNLGLQPPKTMDDVITIAKAFANNDPDGNGKKDTFGLSLDYNLFNGWSGLDGFFNAYHAYPYNPAKASGTTLMFLKGADGKPVFADTMPEVKTALAKLQELFKAGAINPEFGVIDGVKSGEVATKGQVGMSFGQWWVGTWPINNMKKADPKVDWQAYPIVSADDKPVMIQTTGGLPNQFFVVNKNAKHPEAAIKLLNYFMEKLYGKTADEKYHQVVVDGTNYQVFGYAPINGGFSETNQDDYDAVQDALKSGDASKMSSAAKVYYDAIKKYQGGDFGQFNWYSTFGPNGAYSVLGQYKKNNMYVESHYYGTPTETMISKGPTLRDLEATEFTKIIMGTEPIEAFDQFVKNWKAQGGDQILQEVAASGKFK